MTDSLPSVTMATEDWSCRKGRGEIYFAPAMSPWFIQKKEEEPKEPAGLGPRKPQGSSFSSIHWLQLEMCLQLSLLGSGLSFPEDPR